MADRSESDRVPVLQNRGDFDSWSRKFNDYANGRGLWEILTGEEIKPEDYTHQELMAIPVASRYNATHDRKNEMKSFDKKSKEAFAMTCKAMEKDNLIYGCAELDALRQQAPRDPAAAFTLVMGMLKPSHIDAQMTIEAMIQMLIIGPSETIPSLFQRFASMVNRLQLANKPTDEQKMKTIKRAVKGNKPLYQRVQDKIENLMDRDPPITYDEFTTALNRKHEMMQEEALQEAALCTEGTQSLNHDANEDESAHFTQGKGGRGRGGRGRGGRGGRGGGRKMGRGYDDARIGALYSAQGGKGYDSLDNKRPFHRGGGRHDGGRGYDFDSNYGKGGNHYGGRGGGKGKGGRGNQQYKFDGNCNKCGYYGHKEDQCYAKKAKY
jgi:hypothetical protein